MIGDVTTSRLFHKKVKLPKIKLKNEPKRELMKLKINFKMQHIVKALTNKNNKKLILPQIFKHKEHQTAQKGL